LEGVLRASASALQRPAVVLVEESRHRIRHLPIGEASPGARSQPTGFSGPGRMPHYRYGGYYGPAIEEYLALLTRQPSSSTWRWRTRMVLSSRTHAHPSGRRISETG